MLAGVRKETSIQIPARGVPVDVSEPVAKKIGDWDGDWDGDGHSHSFLHKHELAMLLAFLRTGKFQQLIGNEKQLSMACIGRDTFEQPAPVSTQLSASLPTTKVRGMMEASQYEK